MKLKRNKYTLGSWIFFIAQIWFWFGVFLAGGDPQLKKKKKSDVLVSHNVKCGQLLSAM